MEFKRVTLKKALIKGNNQKQGRKTLVKIFSPIYVRQKISIMDQP
jgi:hypothetical protein